jgi:GntR family transcriptional regulator, transcriptional repressor for pyruvate dehydrogenase complex
MKSAVTKASTFSPIIPQRAFEDIASQIRDLVAKGSLKPGDRLPAEKDLAAKFSVSRNTLREALRALEHSGMIELRKGPTGGAFVVPGSSDVIVNGMRDLYHLGAITPKELTEARILLEEVVVRAACAKLTDSDLAALESNVAAAALAHKNGDFDERSKLHLNFHKLLGATTRNPILAITMEGIMEVMRKFVETIGPSENAFTLPSRRRFLKHLRERDADAAAAEMTKLLKRLHAQYLELWYTKQAQS